MASRSITDLDPRLQPLARRFIERARAEGLDPLITCTYRSDDEQERLYAQGRTTAGPIVTNARAGQSAHNARSSAGQPASRAFDVVPLVDGKPMWDAAHPHWQKLGRIGTELGLEWAGNWRRFREFPHFQLPGA